MQIFHSDCTLYGRAGLRCATSIRCSRSRTMLCTSYGLYALTVVPCMAGIRSLKSLVRTELLESANTYSSSEYHVHRVSHQPWMSLVGICHKRGTQYNTIQYNAIPSNTTPHHPNNSIQVSDQLFCPSLSRETFHRHLSGPSTRTTRVTSTHTRLSELGIDTAIQPIFCSPEPPPGRLSNHDQSLNSTVFK
jgi:hypothetical protein